MATDARGPLAGVRVLDASRVLAGPYCGQVLGDLGAEVLKVERPGAGDETRGWGPPFAGDLSAYYLSCNRNKRGLTLDLSRPEGRDLFHELVRRSDVVLENFRADSADRLGLSPEVLLGVNPRVVVCSISGFGRTGPLRDLPGYDFAVQALSGLMSITGPVEGPPCKVGVAVTDVLTGLYAAVAVLSCLRARDSSGHGYAIDLALLDCAVASQVNVAQAYLTGGAVPPRQGNAHLQIVPYQLFATADSWLVLAVGNDGQWQRFCRAAGRSDLAEDARFATNPLRVQNRGDLVPLLEPLLRSRTTAAWQGSLRAAEVPHAPVWDYVELFAHPQAAARSLRVEVRGPDGKPLDLLGSPFHLRGASLPEPATPPTLGQHTDAVLSELLGLGPARLEELRRSGVI
ncbi:MAG TPA: CoA transferase [Gemmataceae bacterium]|jgi:crotonobetainyl-CoA:carnitine CoA-transferase CaiB-like acyl-CoA transferase|nr:CoA transferase [Gemmataceae bacterium]